MHVINPIRLPFPETGFTGRGPVSSTTWGLPENTGLPSRSPFFQQVQIGGGGGWRTRGLSLPALAGAPEVLHGSDPSQILLVLSSSTQSRATSPQVLALAGPVSVILPGRLEQSPCSQPAHLPAPGLQQDPHLPTRPGSVASPRTAPHAAPPPQPPASRFIVSE